MSDGVEVCAPLDAQPGFWRREIRMKTCWVPCARDTFWRRVETMQADPRGTPKILGGQNIAWTYEGVVRSLC
jgi:hypothetical protein